MELTLLGWAPFFHPHFEAYAEQNLTAARIARQDRTEYTILGEFGELAAELPRRFRHKAESRSELPTVGDWVAVERVANEDKAVIQAVLPRKSAFIRKVPGATTDEQVVAANVDIVFLMSGLDAELNLRRIERFLTFVWDCDATPVIVLNKTDICEDVAARVAEVTAVVQGTPVHAISAAARQGLDALDAYFEPGVTVALLGASGVGKSTLVNALLGHDRQAVQSVREDDSRGRHTTVRRELIPLPERGLLMDSPGIRELQLWVDDEGLEATFADIEELAMQCRFRDCGHEGEPGCAVQKAIDEGALDAGRWQSFRKLQAERERMAERKIRAANRAERDKWKHISKIRNQLKRRR